MNTATDTEYKFNNTEKEYLYELMKIGKVTITPTLVQVTSNTSSFNFSEINKQGLSLPATWKIDEIIGYENKCEITYSVKR